MNLQKSGQIIITGLILFVKNRSAAGCSTIPVTINLRRYYAIVNLQNNNFTGETAAFDTVKPTIVFFSRNFADITVT